MTQNRITNSNRAASESTSLHLVRARVPTSKIIPINPNRLSNDVWMDNIIATIKDETKMEVGENLPWDVLPSMNGSRNVPKLYTPFILSFSRLT